MKISVKIFGFYHRKQGRRGRGKTKSEKLKRIRRKKGYKKKSFTANVNVSTHYAPGEGFYDFIK